ncbi:hypothetical protein NP233_g12470 [Leucocoprinus birnbaumii]|uniref:Uncharacterized protein n=1 Tax=Leucocoprinus birnbaumii TaxID=56174 RepID=A0AAD5VGY4_9AGAR|nr:hypothetical protein NP233_g12470 [Leucocoprinus birnbaumii]
MIWHNNHFPDVLSLSAPLTAIDFWSGSELLELPAPVALDIGALQFLVRLSLTSKPILVHGVPVALSAVTFVLALCSFLDSHDFPVSYVLPFPTFPGSIRQRDRMVSFLEYMDLIKVKILLVWHRVESRNGVHAILGLLATQFLTAFDYVSIV